MPGFCFTQNPLTMRLLLKDSIGLIIDIQERLHPKIHDFKQLEHNTQILIKGLKALDVPLLVTQQYTKALGETISPIREVLGEFQYTEKISFSCCDTQDFAEDLEKSGKKNVIIAGEETHVCVLQTTLDLLELGYQPVVVEDCVSSRKPGDKATAIARMRQEGAIITSYESVLFELTRFAGSDTFKQISKLVK